MSTTTHAGQLARKLTDAHEKRRATEQPPVIRFDASTDTKCSKCSAPIAKGDPAGFECGVGPKPVCAPCCDRIEAEHAAGAGGVPDDEPIDLPATPAEQPARYLACRCPNTRDGFSVLTAANTPADEWPAWVHELGREVGAELDELSVHARCSLPTRTYLIARGAPAERIDLAPRPDPEGTPTHDDPAGEPEQPPAAGADEPAAQPGPAGDDSAAGADPAPAAPRRRTGTRNSTRRAARGVREPEAAGRRADGAAEDRDRQREVGDGRADRGAEQRDPQPAPGDAADADAGRVVPTGLEGAEGRGPGDVGAVGEGVGQLAAGPAEVTAPPQTAGVFAAPSAPSDLPDADAPVARAPGLLAQFMSAAPVTLSGNSPWAARYAAELRQIVVDHCAGTARSVQKHLGPSEIGHLCHRQVAGKLAQLPPINNVSDPWPSFMGTAGHAAMEDVLKGVNDKLGRQRFLTEHRVTPTMGFEQHPGTGDGYDFDHAAVIDHKFLGESSMSKLKRGGPPRHYFVQFLLYLLGFHAMGLPVGRIVLLAWPRTGSSVDGLYVWEHEITAADFEWLRDVIEPELRYRKQWAVALLTGAAQLSDVPSDTADECHFCPFYSPAAARDPQAVGCPGDSRPPA